MRDISFVSEAYGAVYLAPQVPCFIIHWTGFANSEQLRHLINEAQYIAEAARHPGALGWIGDLRGLGAVKPTDQHWLHTEWNPRPYQAGVR